jgi:hypothetical protein
MTQMQDGDVCECGHPFSPHIMVPYDDPMDGGLMFCQDPACGCVHTWTVGPGNWAEMPPPDVVAAHRAAVRGG